MRVIPLVDVTDANLSASNVPENDYAAWLIGTTYAADARVISTTTHAIYQSVAGGNVGNDPTDAANIVTVANPTGAWLYVSQTNKWRAFDGRNSAKTRQSGSITYEFSAQATSDAVSFLGLEATTVQVEVLAPTIVTNGTFETDTDWVKGTGWTIAGGKASSDGTQVADALLTTTVAPVTVAAETYEVSFEITDYTAGSVRMNFDGAAAITNKSAVGVYKIKVPASDMTGTVDVIANSTFVGSIDNVTVRQITYDVTKDLLDTSGITTFFGYFTFNVDEFSETALFYAVPIYPATTMRITIDAGAGTAGVASIGFGRRKIIGTTLAGTTPSIIDFSTKETDVFGELIIVERAFSKTVDFNVAFPTSGYKSISRALEPLRATPAIYYENEELTHDLIVLGFYSDFSPPLAISTTLATIQITGVI